MPSGKTLAYMLSKGVNPFAIANKMVKRGQISKNKREEVIRRITEATLAKRGHH